MLIWRLEVITVFVLCVVLSCRSQRSYASDYNRDDTRAPTQLTVSLVTTSCDPLLHALTDTALRHDVEVGALLLSGMASDLVRPSLSCAVQRQPFPFPMRYATGSRASTSAPRSRST